MMKFKRLFLMCTLFFVTIGCDQVSKVVARDNFRLRPPRSFFGDSLRIQFAQNSGAFLSLGADLQQSLRFWIFTVCVSFVLAFTSFLLISGRQRDAISTAGLTLILAGGLGNLIDRIAFGTVTDFLNVGIGSLRTGIFNVADMAILGGVALFLFASQRAKKLIQQREARPNLVR